MGHQNAGASPFGRIPESAEEWNIFRSNIRYKPVFEPGLNHVINNLIVQVMDITGVPDRVSHQMSLLKPSELFPVRTIGCNTCKIAFYRPADKLIY